MSDDHPRATLNDLSWMVGAWEGGLGEQRVREAWSEPVGGVMSTMVRLETADSTAMIELIAIREAGSNCRDEECAKWDDEVSECLKIVYDVSGSPIFLKIC